MAIISPSILSADFSNLKKDIEKVKKASYLHLDIMDGKFVPNITFGPMLIKAIRPYSTTVFDTHLMIENPEKYITDFADAGSDIITFHVEAVNHLDRTIHMVKEAGCKVGVSLNPATTLNQLDYILSELDQVLIMTVNPGYGGQKFIKPMINKIKQLRQRIDNRGLNTKIQIDGGVSLENIKELYQAGVDIFVAGSAIFKSDNPQKVVKKMQELTK